MHIYIYIERERDTHTRVIHNDNYSTISSSIDINTNNNDNNDSNNNMVIITIIPIMMYTSWGQGCANPAYPGVYANVSLLHAWIDIVVYYSKYIIVYYSVV